MNSIGIAQNVNKHAHWGKSQSHFSADVRFLWAEGERMVLQFYFACDVRSTASFTTTMTNSLARLAPLLTKNHRGEEKGHGKTFKVVQSI